MVQADHAYYLRRADEERALAERAETSEAKMAHQQLRDLYLIRVGVPSLRRDNDSRGTFRG